MGAYGGTAQASLAPTKGKSPPVGAVDLRDYWPLTAGNSMVCARPPGGGSKCLAGGRRGEHPDGVLHGVLHLVTFNALGWAPVVYCYYVNHTLYMTQDSPMRIRCYGRPPSPPRPNILSFRHRRHDPGSLRSIRESDRRESIRLHHARYAGGGVGGHEHDPAQFLAGAWPDVIALREKRTDDTLGDPIAIFAAGSGRCCSPANR